VSIKEDVLRALDYGKDAYYQAIQAVPSYSTELARVRTDYNERQWIDFSGFLPKFPTEEFNKRRDQYQAKYGNTVNVPGFSDVIHLVPKARISAEERAAHIWAIERGLPSPLTPDQLETMKYKKYRFLKALSSPTPTWMKTVGAVGTTLDNVEDAFVTIAVLGRIAAKISPRLFKRLIPGLGWILVGSDILNLANLASLVTFAANKHKRLIEDMAEKNPFHAKAKARRTLKLQRTMPTFGEFLEIAQTTDQLFGVGLCLGGLVGMVTDTAAKALDPDYWAELEKQLFRGNVNDISSWAAGAAMNDYNQIKKGLQEEFINLRDEAYRLKATDIKLRKDINNWITKKSNETWGWLKSKPEKFLGMFSGSLIGSMIMSTGKDDFLHEDHTKAYMMLDSAIRGVMPWWLENDPLTNFKELRNWKFKAPEPKDPTTIDILNETSPGWKSTIKWPHLETEYATIEEIAFAYAPKIKDSFQAYALNHSHEYDAMIAGQQVVEFTKNVIRSYSDDGDVVVGMTAWWAVAEDMAREVYLIPPDASKDSINRLQDYIGQYERTHAVPPPIKDVVSFGKSAGIEWMRSVPARAFTQAAEIFPEWSQIQDRLKDLYIPD
jgi:hypothetical protein